MMPSPADETSKIAYTGDLLSVSLDQYWNLLVSISLPLVLGVIAVFFIARWVVLKQTSFGVVELEISLGNIGKAKLKPNYHDIQIAHKIWTELVTRKAAVEIDPDHDVIVEVYNSWYVLFTRIRELISEVPAEVIRRDSSTRQLVDIATRSINDGLRPHLTEWQAKFRNWYDNQHEMLKTHTPQEVQKKYDHFDAMVTDMKKVNLDLIQYAAELKKIANGE